MGLVDGKHYNAPWTVWVTAAAVVGRSHVTSNQKTLAVIGCKRNGTNNYCLVDVIQKMTECRYC